MRVTSLTPISVRIYEFDEQGPLDSEGHVIRVLVFEGSQAEADEFTETEAEDRNYLVPALIIAVESSNRDRGLDSGTQHPDDYSLIRTPRPHKKRSSGRPDLICKLR